MLRSLLCGFALFTIAMAGPVSAQDSGTLSKAIDQHNVELTRTDHHIVLGGAALQPGIASRQVLLAAIETWLSAEFDLPAIHDHPQIELVAAAKIVALRYKGILPDSQTTFVPNDRGTTSAERDTIAVYSDATRTIYLPEGWTGSTSAELSVLVHEVVHHAQNVLGLKYECPQEREKLAYLAQDRWLSLFGRSLASDFELDPMSLLVKTRCF
jgi:hypothetical protein